MRPDDLPDTSGRKSPRQLSYRERSNSHQYEAGPTGTPSGSRGECGDGRHHAHRGRCEAYVKQEQADRPGGKGVLIALEQGRSNPNLATLARIGDAFGVPVTRLVDMSGERSVQISGPGGPVVWHGPPPAAPGPSWARRIRRGRWNCDGGR
jgi:transcriptional regulator with XRE-family HTH domain